MVTNVKPTTNGTTKNSKDVATPGTSETKVLSIAKEKDLKPLEDRMHRINELWTLQGKHQRLNESKSRLKSFLTNVEKDNLQITIKCTDYSSREEFTTKNSTVIEEILNCLITTTDEKIKEIEPKLNW